MPETSERILDCAEQLDEAQNNLVAIRPLTNQFSDLTVQEAYQIQLHNVHVQQSRGHKIVGHKVGLTSKPMQNMLGVPEPDFGHLFDSMWYQSGDTIDYPLLQPRVEPELAFVLKADLVGPHITVADVLRSTDFVVPAIEIIDSRVEDWKIKLVDTVSDNASSGCFALGDVSIGVHQRNLATLGGQMRKNGQIVQTGAGAAVLGHPATSVAWLANKLNELGTTLRAGQVVLSGAISAAVSVEPGDEISVFFANLGSVHIAFPS